VLTQQPASKREAEGRRRCDAVMEFGVVGLLSCCRGRHRRCISSSSPGELFATDDDHDDDDNDNEDDDNDNNDDRRHY
jgi:hypothetical protein